MPLSSDKRERVNVGCQERVAKGGKVEKVEKSEKGGKGGKIGNKWKNMHRKNAGMCNRQQCKLREFVLTRRRCKQGSADYDALCLS